MRWPVFVASLLLVVANAARAHPAADWHDALVEADLKPGGPPFARAAAIMHVAMFDAVNAIEGGYRSYRTPPPFSTPASSAAAGHAAAHAVLRQLYQASAAQLDRRLEAALSAAPEVERANGVRLGVAIAKALLAERENDGWTGSDTYRPFTQPGRYVPTTIPAVAWASEAKPFVLFRPSLYRPPVPYALSSPEWARDLEEVRALGGLVSAQRTDAQTHRAKFIAVSHLKFWMQPAAAVVREERPSLLDGARALALLSLAIADSFLASFEAKYHHGFWRPVTAIRNADLDGNDATVRDASWKPLVDTPMHPEYPCQHCIGAAATSTVLRAGLGDRARRLSLRNPAFPEALVVAADEIEALSIEGRIHGGVHYRASCDAGRDLGRQVAAHMVREALVPLR